MKINAYQVTSFQSGDILFGYRSGSPDQTLGFSGVGDLYSNLLEFELSSSDILSLATGIEVLPNLQSGSNNYYDVVAIWVEFTSGSIPYVSSENLYFTGCVNAVIPNSLLEYATPSVKLVSVVRDGVSSVSGTPQHMFFISNTGLVVSTEGVAPTSGNGTMRLTVGYNIRTFGS